MLLLGSLVFLCLLFFGLPASVLFMSKSHNTRSCGVVGGDVVVVVVA